MSDQHDSAETRQLLDELRAGEQTAREALFEHHRDFLRQFIHRRLDQRLRRRIDPSDVVQEVFLNAAERLPEYLEHPPMAFRTWLFRNARDKLIMHHRQHLLAEKRTIHREIPLPDDSSLLIAQQFLARGPSPSERLNQAETHRQILQAMEELSHEDREILLMRHFEGLSNQEVAEILDIKGDTASQRHHRALDQLREQFVKCGLFPEKRS